MTDIKYTILCRELNCSLRQVENVVKLLFDGCSIPFISRYRKEVTGNLDEVTIQNIKERYDSLCELEKRKEYIISVIKESGKLDDALKTRIDDCWDSSVLEDLYLPFKPKRRTRAEIARNNGLEPLAKLIFSQREKRLSAVVCRFVSEQVPTEEDALAGAMDIIAEWVAENEKIRSIVREAFDKYAVISGKVIKGKEVEGANFSSYFDFSEPLKKCSSHRILALRRGESEGFLRVSINIDEEFILNRLTRFFVKNGNESSEYVKLAVTDSYKRLIKPAIESEFAAVSKAKADDIAISMFADNLRQLLFSAPLYGKRVMGVDPGYRTGCKIVCLDAQGNLLHNDVIYPNAPQNDIKTSARKITQLVEAYRIDALSIGNGTASRETERFLQNLRYDRKVQIFVVSENGASIYSASKIARDEFPDKDVTVRGAVSIGRRLIDPLAELVKIDPKSIGVGQYQHDVDQKKLKNALNFTVESCVNNVGVNLNSASKELLTYVSGLGPQLAQNIVDYRSENGDFSSRKELLKVPRMGAKSFQQSAGFLRIPNGSNVLDNTAVHPESYYIVEKFAKDLKCPVSDLIRNKELKEKLRLSDYVSDTVGLYTLNDILNELEKPGRDPRTKVDVLEFDENVKTISDVVPGMILNGIVTNITQFGAFVDFGIKENGLLHISEMCDRFISSPSEIVKLHQHLKVRILDVDLNRKRVSLSLKDI